MKHIIREEILKKRGKLDEKEWIEKSDNIQNKFLNSDFYRKAGAVLLYCHFDREVRTDLLIKDALNRNKIVCVPFNNWKTMTFFPARIYSLDEIDRKGKIPQPFIPEPFPAEYINLAVIPGVVFDLYGNRIGMGKGFFDRFIENTGEDMLKAAFAFDLQVLEEKLPVDLWDRKIDVIITETRTIKTGGENDQDICGKRAV